MKLTQQKEEILNLFVNDLKGIDGIIAIVLGGSHATGEARETSDLDIGLYYHENHPFDIGEIKKVVEKYTIDSHPTVTDFYQWGPWVNGGAWMNTSAGKVGFHRLSILPNVSAVFRYMILTIGCPGSKKN